MRNTSFIVVGVVACLVSCAPGDGEDSQSHDTASGNVARADTTRHADREIIHGHYIFGHETRSLRPCDQGDALWVVDHTNLLKDLYGELALGAPPFAEVFIAVAGHIGPPPAEGFGADYAGSLTVERVLYMAAEGFGCEFDWSRFTYRAQGNEPFWMLEVLPTQMRLIRPGHEDVTWTSVTERSSEGAVIFSAGDDSARTVELVITPGAGRDTMSGAYYGLSARLALGVEVLTGYALPGK